MALFLTGATGYVGVHVAAALLERHADDLLLLVRAGSDAEAERRLWRSFQLLEEFPAFAEQLRSRIRIVRGDLTASRFGLDASAYDRLVRSTDSIVHCAASLNRRSHRTCVNVNMRGTLEVIKLALAADADHGVRRFSYVSTVAVAGHRAHEMVTEDEAIDWNRSEYDPYARTKRFCEHMIRELLPTVPFTIVRPSIVLGDSRRPETTQFDMVRAFVFLATLPIAPLRPDDRVDIVPVNFVADAIVALHQKADTTHDTYHLTSGRESLTYRQIADAIAAERGVGRSRFAPLLEKPFGWVVNRLATARHLPGRMRGGAVLMQVFLPYLVWDTVFDNTRVVQETSLRPAPFSEYCHALFSFATRNRFRYPYREWPASATGRAV
jgi:thioester reductase-like protein